MTLETYTQAVTATKRKAQSDFVGCCSILAITPTDAPLGVMCSFVPTKSLENPRNAGVP